VGIVEHLALSPWVVATPPLERELSRRARAGSSLRWFDPLRVASRAFLDELERIDEVTFGPTGLRMPRWAFYDCAELPGTILGFGGSRAALPQTLLGPSEESDFVPVSMCMATPMVTPGEWLVYSLSSLLERDDPAGAAELEAETLALALELLEPASVHGTMQWESANVAVFAEFAPISIRATWVPAHTHAATLVLRLDAAERRAHPRGELPDGFSVDPRDHARLAELQKRIEAGERLELVGIEKTAGLALPRVAWGSS